MKKFFLGITFLFSLLMANAQTTIKGLLVDSLTHEGEPYATIRICKEKQEDKPVVMAVTDIDGKFSPEIKSNGKYIISFTSVGRTPIKRNIIINGEKEIDLGTLLVSDDETTLAGVEVVAHKPIVKMEADKMTYSVEDDVDSKSMSVLDMLRKVPMVTVDGQDNISVNGSSSFKIYVDGKPNAMLSSNASTILKAMPASAVSSIEVITNPGAKYDAEGAAGILDIKMAKIGGSSAKEGLNGYNGSVNVNGGNKGYGAGVYVAGQQGKFSYNANMDYMYMDNGTIAVDMERVQSDGSTLKVVQPTRNTLPIVMGNIAMGYEVDSMSTVNASFGITSYNIKSEGSSEMNMYGGVYGSGFRYGSNTLTKMKRNSFEGSLDYQRFLNADRSSSITMTYQVNTNPSTTKTNTENDVPETYAQFMNLDDRISDAKTNTFENVLQLDLVTKLSNVSTLSSGLKYANRKNTSDSDYSLAGQYRDDLSTDYTHTDQIGAVYAELDNHWASWSVKGGLRYEQTWQKVKYNQGNGSDFTKNYGNLVPSASISHTLTPGSSIGLTYNMRIARPGITYLNPYVDRTDPTSLTYGNTGLYVEKSHNIGLVYNSYSQKLMWNATLKQTFDNGGIEQYSFYATDAEDNYMNKLNTTYGNIVNRRVTSLTLFAMWSMTKNTRIIFNGGGSYNDLRSKELGQNAFGWMGNAMVSVQQTLPKQWNLSLTAMTNSKSLTLQGRNSGMNIGVLSVTKNMFNDKLSISASAITGLSKGGKLHMDQHTEGDGFTSKMNISVPLTRVQATVTWKFGNTKKQFQEHTTNIKSDYIEHQSSTESMGSAGKM